MSEENKDISSMSYEELVLQRAANRGAIGVIEELKNRGVNDVNADEILEGLVNVLEEVELHIALKEKAKKPIRVRAKNMVGGQVVLACFRGQDLRGDESWRSA